ncbi:cytochrome P450 2G1-like isoform X2 [Pelodiscus sinensis]
MFPALLAVLPGRHNAMFRNADALRRFVSQQVTRHQARLDPSAPDSYIDCFLLRMAEEKQDPHSAFRTENLVMTTLELFFAGTETVSTTLRYGLLLLMKHPEIQEKVHEEIERVMGRARPPAIEDRSRMPYTDAVIHEVQRFADILPMNLPHATTQDVQFRGYTIPQGTTILPLLTSVLRDASQFEHPDDFEPRHFLDEKGRFQKSEAFMPFSAVNEPPTRIREARAATLITRPPRAPPRPLPAGSPPAMELALATLLLLCIAGMLLASAWQRRTQPGPLPPGPTPLPLLGNFLQLDRKNFLVSFQQMWERYGPVFTVHLGTRRVVVLCGYRAVKEALLDQAEDFSGRGEIPAFSKDFNGHGVAFANGERWRQLRRFCLSTLRDFGMGKRGVEERIREEAQCLLEELQKTKGAPFDPTFNLSRAVSNVICSIVFGSRFEYTDETFVTLNKLIYHRFRFAGLAPAQLYNSFPGLLEKLPGPHHAGSKYSREIIRFITERIKMHQAVADLSMPQSFIDCFLVKMEQEKQNPATEFFLENLVMATFNLFFAGTETVSTTLRYGFLILLKYPQVQEKIHQEIDAVVGRDRTPTTEDRGRMPYTDATLHEIQRFCDILPMSLPHTVIRDTWFRGYLLPKGTYVYPLLSTVHFDPEQHQAPDTFAPERFLDENGCFRKHNAFMPFSAGKRVCLGESLARMELFLFFTGVLQRFALRSPVAPQQLSLVPGVNNFGKMPQPYQLCLHPR